MVCHQHIVFGPATWPLESPGPRETVLSVSLLVTAKAFTIIEVGLCTLESANFVVETLPVTGRNQVILAIEEVINIKTQ